MSPVLKTETLALRFTTPVVCWTLVLVLHHPQPSTTCTCKLLQQCSVVDLPQSQPFLIPYVSASWERDPYSFPHGSGVCAKFGNKAEGVDFGADKSPVLHRTETKYWNPAWDRLHTCIYGSYQWLCSCVNFTFICSTRFSALSRREDHELITCLIAFYTLYLLFHYTINNKEKNLTVNGVLGFNLWLLISL
jgi:hypothetical protein